MTFITNPFDAPAALSNNRIGDACGEGAIEVNTVAIGLDERMPVELRQLARVRPVEPSAPGR